MKTLDAIRLFNVSRRTLFYWEDKKYITPLRNGNDDRDYSNVIKQLWILKLCQTVGAEYQEHLDHFNKHGVMRADLTVQAEKVANMILGGISYMTGEW